MSAPFDFEAFISGLTVDLPREQVPLYTVIHQSRIDDLDAQIEAASDPDAPGADEREASSGATALVRERDALVKEQDESAHWITLRCLTTQEFADEVQAAAGALASSFSRVRRYSRETVARSRGLVSGSRRTASRRSLSASRRAVVVGSVVWVIRGSR